MVKAVERAHEIGADAIQIFSDNPTAWRRRTAPPKELPAFRSRLAAYGIEPVAIHAAYLVNLAGPEPTFWERSVEILAHELRTGRGFGARYVNVHIGSHRGTGVEAGIDRLTDGVARALAEVEETAETPMIVLENSSGGGFGLGTTVEQLAALAEAIARSRHRRGACRLLPRRRPCLGRGVRPLQPGRDRRAPGRRSIARSGSAGW